MTEVVETEVAVVGGGLAGLTAAYTLNGAGYESTVLEARDRIGGRVFGARVADEVSLDLGGTWFSPGKRSIAQLAAELGVGSHPTFEQGARLLEIRGEVRRFAGSVPPLGPRALYEAGKARTGLDLLARTLPDQAPWLAADARQWDRLTLGQWLDGKLRTRDARMMIELAVRSIWGAEPDEVNLLQALSYINSMDGFDALTRARGGLLADRFLGGANRVPERLADVLGARVRTSCPVHTVRVERGSVVIESDDLRVRARSAVVAAPPALAARIDFDPPPRPARRRALAGLPAGSVTKAFAVYDHPFWTEMGFSGQAVSDSGPAGSIFDVSPPDGRAGVLVGLITGNSAMRHAELHPDQRRTAVLAAFSRLFGKRAATPEHYLEKNWKTDLWSRGCYFGLAERGAITTDLSTIAVSEHPIYWAGAETSWQSFGGMDGAVASGRRAARQVLAASERAPAVDNAASASLGLG